MASFEQGFEEVERAATAAAKASTGLLGVAKQMQKAAKAGDIAAIRRAADRLAAAVDVARQEVADARRAWPFSDVEEEAYLRGSYEQELIETGRAIGLRMTAQDGRLLAYPSILRVLASERAVKVDRKRVTALRPSRLSAQLKDAQGQKPRFSADRFLESIFRAYALLVGEQGIGRSVALTHVHGLLTLLPGAASDYSTSDFVRDLFTLDRSGVERTRSGHRVSLPASTGTKSARNTLSFVAPDGELVTYYAVRFEAGR